MIRSSLVVKFPIYTTKIVPNNLFFQKIPFQKLEFESE